MLTCIDVDRDNDNIIDVRAYLHTPTTSYYVSLALCKFVHICTYTTMCLALGSVSICGYGHLLKERPPPWVLHRTSSYLLGMRRHGAVREMRSTEDEVRYY